MHQFRVGEQYPDAALRKGSKLHYDAPAFLTTEKRAWKPVDLQRWDEERKSLRSSVSDVLLQVLFRWKNGAWHDMPFILMSESRSNWTVDDINATLQDCLNNPSNGIPFIQLAVEDSTNVILRMDVLALPNDLSIALLKCVTNPLSPTAYV